MLQGLLWLQIIFQQRDVLIIFLTANGRHVSLDAFSLVTNLLQYLVKIGQHDCINKGITTRLVVEVTADHMAEFSCTSCSAGRRWYYTGAPLTSHLYETALWRLVTFGASVSRQPTQTSMFLVLGVNETTNPTMQLKFSFTALNLPSLSGDSV